MNYLNIHLTKAVSYGMAAVLLALLTFSCNEDSKNSSAVYTDIMKSEVLTKKALKDSWNFLKKGQELANEKYGIPEILKIFPDSTLYQANNNSILFFIEGSVPMLIRLPRDSTLQGVYKGAGHKLMTPVVRTPKALYMNTMNAFMVQEDKEVDVVGNQRGEEEREDKKALIISPYLSEFGENDDGLIAKKHLEKNKNYKGRIDHLTQNVELAAYTSFAEYDLVHLSTHGERLCDAAKFAGNQQIEIVTAGESNFCKILLDTGIKHNFNSEEDIYDFYLDPDNIEYVGNIIHDDTYFHLKSSFFMEFYGEGLEDKIWIFSACELGQRNDITDAIKGVLTNSHFFYWLNTVEDWDAFQAFDKFYENLVKEGLDAAKSFDEIPSDLKTNLPSSFNDSILTTTSLLHELIEEPRHGIEIIEMWHPEEKKAVESGIFYPIVGDFGDGKEEALTLKVQLKGYSRAEFEEEQMTISLKVDEETVLNKKPFLPDTEEDEITVEDLENHEYGLEVTIADIDIPDCGDKDQLTLKAYLHLNDQDFSIHKEMVTIKADGIIATLRGAGNTVKFTYDGKIKAVKVETQQAPRDTYFDSEGFIYNYNKSKGWIKLNFGGMLSALPMADSFSGSGFDALAGEGSEMSFFPMVEWGIRFRMSAFERNTNFKKSLTDCGKSEPCHKFTGTAGQELGTYAIFNPGGRLEELYFKGQTIHYEYGDFNVTLPDAQIFSIGL